VGVQYDDQGRVKARIGSDGFVTNFIFDKYGQLSQLKRNGQQIVEYQRDAAGQLIGEKDSVGRIKRIERDIRGNLLAEYLPNGTSTIRLEI
jgi:YD repeat-containing protein